MFAVSELLLRDREREREKDGGEARQSWLAHLSPFTFIMHTQIANKCPFPHFGTPLQRRLCVHFPFRGIAIRNNKTNLSIDDVPFVSEIIHFNRVADSAQSANSRQIGREGGGSNKGRTLIFW